MKVCNSVLVDPDLHNSDADWDGFNPSWYFAGDGFNSEEVDAIKKLKDVYSFKRGTTWGKTPETTNGEVRESEIFWIQQSIESEWIYNRMSWHINKANKEQYRFDIHSLEQIQYSRYKAPDVLGIEDKIGIRSHRDNNKQDPHYSWHADCGASSYRKLSCVVQLTDKIDYEGGELETNDHKGSIIHGKEKGSIIIFPSFVIHRVHPVTSGIRESLALWVHGPTYR